MRMKPTSTIKADLGIDAGGRIQKFFTDTCYKHMDKYVPLGDTGLLRTNVTKGADYITYEQNYAHAQYIGVVNGHPVRNYTTPRYRSILGQKNVECRKNKSNSRSSK